MGFESFVEKWQNLKKLGDEGGYQVWQRPINELKVHLTVARQIRHDLSRRFHCPNFYSSIKSIYPDVDRKVTQKKTNLWIKQFKVKALTTIKAM
jgi:hypothetical protein